MSENRRLIINDFGFDEDEDKLEEAKKHDISIPVDKMSKMAQTYINYIYNQNDEDSWEDLYELMGRFENQEVQSGTSDDFHNFCVALAKYGEYDLACKVLDKGLEAYPRNADLNSDYLLYGIKCNRLEQCERAYETLLKIPRRRWTWRSFSFAIDYYDYLAEACETDEELDEKEAQMLEIAEDFRKKFPYSEEPYRAKANIYKNMNMQEEEFAILDEALKSVKVAPKCALRFADILFERGMYEEAEEAVRRGIDDAMQTQTSVNEGYIYFLSGLCKIAISQRNKEEMSEEKVNEIFSDFNLALSKFKNNKTNFHTVMENKTLTLINKYGFDIDTKFEYLSELING